MKILKNSIKYIINSIYWLFFNIINNTRINNSLVSIKSKIGKHVIVRKNTFIYGKISIGDYSYISGPNTLINSAIIGKFCSIARNVTIGPGNHNLNYITTHPFLYSKEYNFIKENKKNEKNEPPVIGNDVWIGMNSIILNNIIIGDGAIIGAGSVVTKNVEPYSIVAGVPAKLIKYRFSNYIIDELIKIKWWDWPEELIRQRLKDFYDIELFINKYKII